ncbi:MAG: hypothetical protein RIR79_1260 [Pseudomonadota bacterium]|jgi:prevent-host-death family protein
MITMTSMQAQNRFGQLLDTVQREPVTITRHGRTAALMVSIQDMQAFWAWQASQTQNKLTPARAAFDAFFEKSDAMLTPAATKLTDKDVLRMVKEAM